MRRSWVLPVLLCLGCRNQDGEIAYLGSKTTATVEGKRVAPSQAGEVALAPLAVLGWELASASRVGEGPGNSAVLPMGFAHGAALMANAADGVTREKLTGMLSVAQGELGSYNDAQASLLTLLADEGTLAPANSVWCIWPLPIRPEYESEIAPSYWAKVANLGSAGRESVGQINAWASKQTRGKIPKLVDRLDPQTAVVFSTALAAHLSWEQPFPAATSVPFRSPSGTIDVPTFGATRTYLGAALDGVQFARSRKGPLEATLILPRPGQSPASLVRDLSDGLALKAEAAFAPRRGRLQFPLVHLESSKAMAPVMERLPGGASLAQPDLRYLSHELADGFRISLHQKLVLELDGTSQGGPEPRRPLASNGTQADFVADRPFLILLEYKYGSQRVPLVIAAISDPRQQSQ